MPDEPPDAWPACPVVWEGGGRPAPLPDVQPVTGSNREVKVLWRKRWC
jgi:hypothetical protein